MENNLRPSVLTTLYDIEEQIKKIGLTDDDLIFLLQKRIRIKGKYNSKRSMTKREIREVITGLKNFEKELIQNQNKEVKKIE